MNPHVLNLKRRTRTSVPLTRWERIRRGERRTKAILDLGLRENRDDILRAVVTTRVLYPAIKGLAYKVAKVQLHLPLYFRPLGRRKAPIDFAENLYSEDHQFNLHLVIFRFRPSGPSSERSNTSDRRGVLPGMKVNHYVLII